MTLPPEILSEKQKQQKLQGRRIGAGRWASTQQLGPIGLVENEAVAFGVDSEDLGTVNLFPVDVDLLWLVLVRQNRLDDPAKTCADAPPRDSGAEALPLGRLL